MGYDKLLVTLDGSELAACAIDSARKVANRGAKVHLLSVVKDRATADTSLAWVVKASFGVEYMLPAAVQESTVPQEFVRRARYLDFVKDYLAAFGFEVSTEIGSGPVAGAILDRAQNFELLIMATHGRTGLSRIVLGSVTEAVLHNTSCPLLIVPAHVESQVLGPGYKCILVSLDGSPESEAILPEVERVLQSCPAKVVLLRVMPHATLNINGLSLEGQACLGISAERQLCEYLEVIARRLERLGATAIIETNFNKPGEEIQLAADHYHADLIAMATHGRSGLNRLLQASVTEYVLHHAHCPMLITRVPNTDQNH